MIFIKLNERIDYRYKMGERVIIFCKLKWGYLHSKIYFKY